MSEFKNSDVVKHLLKAVVAVAGRRTLDSFVVKSISTIIKTLEQEYDFLRYVKVKDVIYSEDGESVIATSEIDSIDPFIVGKVIDIIIRRTYEGLDNDAGLYFITELKDYIGENYVSEIKNRGVDLDIIQSEQHELYSQQDRKNATPTKEVEKEPRGEKQKKDEESLDYAWGDVSTWKYDNNVCTLYKSDDSLLDTLHLDLLVEDYVNRYTKYKEPETPPTTMLEISKKEFEFLETLYTRDMDIGLAIGLLDISKQELDSMVNKFLELDILQHISDTEVKLTQKGILCLLEKIEKGR